MDFTLTERQDPFPEELKGKQSFCFIVRWFLCKSYAVITYSYIVPASQVLTMSHQEKN